MSHARVPSDSMAPAEGSQIASDIEDEWISLKLDDKIFTTTKSTLLSDESSLLYVMFNQNSPWNLPRDLTLPGAPYLLDRSPKYFAPVLAYLRTGEVIIDEGVSVKGVLTEAKYLNITSLVQEIEHMNTDDTNKQTPELTRRDIVKALIKCSDSESSNGKLRFQGLNLCGLDLSGLDLSHVNFSRCNLTRAKFCYANLSFADLRWCNLTDADCSHANLYRGKCRNAKMRSTLLISSNMQCADLTFCDLSNAVLRNSDLLDADLSNCLIINSDLSGANMNGVKLKNSTLSGCTHTNSIGGVIAK
ncbi:BTB/POZ domain-containing protein [Acrasis kona]|uniref:BTB/POZ domain-containing protein n=1 Tax=Acrasis kona TaxID=1008807 RepID=A0AAW2Z0Q1_9EUKA